MARVTKPVDLERSTGMAPNHLRKGPIGQRNQDAFIIMKGWIERINARHMAYKKSQLEVCGAAMMTYLEMLGLLPAGFQPANRKMIIANQRIMVFPMGVS